MAPAGILPIAQLQPGRGNCENFALLATDHPDARNTTHACESVNQLISDDELFPVGDTDTFVLWICPICGYREERYVPLNSDVIFY